MFDREHKASKTTIGSTTLESLLLFIIAISPSVPSLVFFDRPIWILQHGTYVFMGLWLVSYFCHSRVSNIVKLGFALSLAVYGHVTINLGMKFLKDALMANLVWGAQWVFLVLTGLVASIYYENYIKKREVEKVG